MILIFENNNSSKVHREHFNRGASNIGSLESNGLKKSGIGMIKINLFISLDIFNNFLYFKDKGNKFNLNKTSGISDFFNLFNYLYFFCLLGNL